MSMTPLKKENRRMVKKNLPACVKLVHSSPQQRPALCASSEKIETDSRILLRDKNRR